MPIPFPSSAIFSSFTRVNNVLIINEQDAAGIAMEAINYARDSRIDVVLVDTAGRMQVQYCK